MRKQVLIVDDSITVRKILEHTLSDAGYEVTAAVNGKQALERATIVHYDLLVTDLQMPVMDGFELVREFRKISGCRFTPTIMLTSEKSEQKKSESVQVGVNGWLNKPFQSEQILQIIKIITPQS